MFLYLSKGFLYVFLLKSFELCATVTPDVCVLLNFFTFSILGGGLTSAEDVSGLVMFFP